MRMLSKVLAGTASALALTALLAAPAMADPPPGVTPKSSDIVGVGSDTTQFLNDQLSHNFNKTGASEKLYSWDAVPQGAMITPKRGCSSIVRPTGSGAGISALETSQTLNTGTRWCIDFARSSSSRASTDPPCAANGICYVQLAGDAVTWASRAAGSNAPASLTLTQLKNIYTCKVRNWNKVGGKTGTINAYLPQSLSGTRKFFLTVLGGGTTPITPGSCTNTVNDTLIENQGDAPQLNNVNAIYPYSVADFLAQKYHSAECSQSNCGYPAAPSCIPSGKQNLFGCDLTGVLTLRQIAGTKPALPWPLPPAPTPPAINNQVRVNTAFSRPFQRIVNTVVRFANNPTKIPTYLQPLFSPTGYVCSKAGQEAIKAYGFLVIPSCGSAS